MGSGKRSQADGPKRLRIPPTPEELARAHEDALLWRARLRSEDSRSAPPQGVRPLDGHEERPHRDDAARRRARFAMAIARAEFGRFYRAGPARLGKSGPTTPARPVNGARRP